MLLASSKLLEENIGINVCEFGLPLVRALESQITAEQ